MEWKTVKLGNISTIIAGGDAPKGRISKVPTSDFSIPIYSNGIDKEGLYGYTDKPRIMEPATTITARGTIGVAFRRIHPYLPIVRLISVVGNKNIVDPNYLYYCLKNTIIVGDGSVQAQLTVPMISDYTISLPPLETQRRIASILSSLDDKIENNNRINRNLEAQAQALFKSWFVDFEPFGGVMPEDWREGVLGNVARVANGKRPPMKESFSSTEINIPLIGAADIMGYTNAVLYSTPILVTGRVGTHGVVQRFNEPCWPSDNTLVVESDCYEFTYQIMKRIDYHNMNRGSTQPLITQTDLKNQKINIPSESVLAVFEKRSKLLYDMVANNLRENQRLAALRDTLLPKLMKGEIEL